MAAAAGSPCHARNAPLRTLHAALSRPSFHRGATMTHRLLVLALSAALAAPLAVAHNHGGDAKPADAAAHDAHEQAKAGYS